MIHTLADITGTGAVVPLSATSINARWVQVTAGTSNASDVRLGDVSTTSSRGIPLSKGDGQFLPGPDFLDAKQYALNAIYVYVANSDTVSVAWGD